MALETRAKVVHKLSPLFSGREGDPVPAAAQTLIERGRGPLPHLKISRLLVPSLSFARGSLACRNLHNLILSRDKLVEHIGQRTS